MEKRLLKVLVSFIIVGLIMSSFRPIIGIEIDERASWKGHFGNFGSTNTNVTIVGESSTEWIVNVTHVIKTNTDTVTGNITEHISKNDSFGGFPVKADGDYWALWINLLNVSETPELVVTHNLTAIPLFSVLTLLDVFYAPYTFEVEAGIFQMVNETYNVWVFMTKYLSFVYDADTGLLLSLGGTFPSASLYAPFSALLSGFTFQLQTSTFSGVESSDVFTLDVVVVSLCVFVLGIVLWRKRHVHKKRRLG